MFGKKKVKKLEYDPGEKYPVIRCSICNGEQVAGLRNRKTGDFEEVMLIRGTEDLLAFQEMAGTEDIGKEY
ncbi:MAG: aspartate dehydrogenase [Blautia sp.]|nr:aspartate dehydrogenase [Blautia sp.]